ncbi:MAG: cytochrome c subunit of cbb3 type cytochrome oxidase [Verrucomicrobiales bacterium]|nr:cytochrome c subunit of cbb3 type cytochrome oxidase [Verrucomicrobiales bacterium]
MITLNKFALNCCLIALLAPAQAQSLENPAPAPAPAPTPTPAAGPASSPEAILATGKAVYNTTCIACHQPTGLGLPPLFPPLKGSDWVAAPKPGRVVRIVLHGAAGPIKVNGVAFNGTMPGHGVQLTDDKIAAVITYIRQEYGNKASPVSTEYVAAARAAFKDRGAPWTEAELLAVPDK